MSARFFIAAPGVLANDTDAAGSALTATLVHGPAHGILLLNPDGSFVYLPNRRFVGTDTFTYTASDGVNTSNTATVTIDVRKTGRGGHHDDDHDEDDDGDDHDHDDGDRDGSDRHERDR